MPATEKEIRDLYDRYAPVLYRRSLAILGNPEDARDAVQETFARVVLHWESFRQDSSPLTWMYRISTNWCLNRIRNRRGRERKRQVHRQDIAGDGVSPAAAESWERAHLARRLLDEADDETRRILIHLYFDDMTREEAARMAGISVPTLRKRLNRFFKRSRRILGAPYAILLALLVP